jgi:hypothetical protein
LALLTFALASPQARARTGAPDEGGPPPEPPVKVTIFPLPHPDIPEETVVGVVRALDAGLKKNSRLEMHDLDSRLADFAQEVPQDQVEAARTASKDGQKAMLELNIPLAIQKLKDAVAGLTAVLPYIKKQELAEAMCWLAVAYFEDGRNKEATDELAKLLTWRSDFVYDPQKYPPKYLPDFDAASKANDKVKRGSIMITSNPDGAQAYVDGKYIGVTPCTAEGLTSGEHFVTYKKEGFKKALAPATVSSKKELRVNVPLERSEKFLLVEQALQKLGGALGADMAPKDMDDLKQVLLIDHGIFLRFTDKGGGKLEVDAILYDLRTRRRLSRVTKTVPRTAAETQLSTLASSLYLNVDYNPELVAPKDAPPPPKLTRAPLYKTWWFWTAAVAVVAAAVVIPVAVVESRPAGCPDGFTCYRISE